MVGAHEFNFTWKPLEYSHDLLIPEIDQEAISVLPGLVYMPVYICFSDLVKIPFTEFCAMNPVENVKDDVDKKTRERKKTEKEKDKDFVKKYKAKHPWCSHHYSWKICLAC